MHLILNYSDEKHVDGILVVPSSDIQTLTSSHTFNDHGDTNIKMVFIDIKRESLFRDEGSIVSIYFCGL